MVKNKETDKNFDLFAKIYEQHVSEVIESLNELEAKLQKIVDRTHAKIQKTYEVDADASNNLYLKRTTTKELQSFKTKMDKSIGDHIKSELPNLCWIATRIVK